MLHSHDLPWAKISGRSLVKKFKMHQKPISLNFRESMTRYNENNRKYIRIAENQSQTCQN